jgi:hypothetical protein
MIVWMDNRLVFCTMHTSLVGVRALKLVVYIVFRQTIGHVGGLCGQAGSGRLD